MYSTWPPSSRYLQTGVCAGADDILIGLFPFQGRHCKGREGALLRVQNRVIVHDTQWSADILKSTTYVVC